ncbi:DUF4920 domain-containing protein [Mucilaginibacter celer]|uniref:DUF4920 domain-containing protein n=1 Tax=Mucilaginibacter celer TaxID=2305508 RepID=A0A494VQB8_9SPHI|nr:DUF4920 domain-containing protein [Mucilaginibacter celer]AYL97717.1 DUF4920 domain-containing protein [Mucilaginibacter celer]
MKKLMPFIILVLFSVVVQAQKHTPLPHGMVYGQKPDTMVMMQASKLEDFMGKKTRITTAIEGKVISVTQEKGGWFEMDAGNGRIISAHFYNAGISIPKALAGRTVIISGIAAKQFIADDMQHLAGDTVTGKKQHKVKTDPKRVVTFEVKGLMVDK